jgi:putative ABC transport system substrate-binding protein
MRRRNFILSALFGGAVVAWPLPARTQQAVRMRRIGVLMPYTQSNLDAQRYFDAFTQALRQVGWSEGKNIVYEMRYSDGKPERLPALAAELVEANPDVIVTYAAQAVDALRKATSTIPIVMGGVGDALGAGYVASLARPGGNITGLTLVATDQTVKRLQLLQQISPGLIRVAVLWNPNASGHRFQMKDLEPAAPGLGIVLQSLPVRQTDEIDAALRATIQANAQGLFIMEDPMIESNRPRIAEFAMQQRLPAIGKFRPMAVVGALMS